MPWDAIDLAWTSARGGPSRFIGFLVCVPRQRKLRIHKKKEMYLSVPWSSARMGEVDENEQINMDDDGPPATPDATAELPRDSFAVHDDKPRRLSTIGLPATCEAEEPDESKKTGDKQREEDLRVIIASQLPALGPVLPPALSTSLADASFSAIFT